MKVRTAILAGAAGAIVALTIDAVLREVIIALEVNRGLQMLEQAGQA